jgi:copper(I)-binding protein
MRTATITPRRFREPRGLRLPILVSAFAVAVVGAGALAGCGTDNPPPAATNPTTAAAEPATSVQDPWAKAADSGMTAVFGTLVNPTGSNLTVVSATSTVSKTVELHEVADVDGKAVMREKDGGFVIPANGRHELKPGGDHLMLMALTQPVRPGDEVTVTLSLKDGGTLSFTAIAKEFAGGKENYRPGMAGGKP